nr:hypothetical protein [Nitrosomonas nitrosa]
MRNLNFYDQVKPWLDQIKDNPDKPLDINNSTTFPTPNTKILSTFDFDWDNSQLTEIVYIDDSDLNLPEINVSEIDVNAARDARSFAGPDTLAFYKSFRFIDRQPFCGKWGIFLFDAGIEGLAHDLIKLEPTLSKLEVIQFATKILLEHEQYHFWIDVWGLGQEIVSLNLPFMKRYEYYFSEKRKIELTPEDYEESLANHYVFAKLRNYKFINGQTASSVLEKILLNAPSPYSDCFFDSAERTKRESGLALAVANGESPTVALAWQILQFQDFPFFLGASIQPDNRLQLLASGALCPIYFVQTKGYAALVTPFQGPKLTEIEDFIKKYLDGKKDKYTDHQYYKIDNRESIKFPNPHDKEVRGYEFKGILKKAGMTQQEFNAAKRATNDWKRNCPRRPVKPPLP